MRIGINDWLVGLSVLSSLIGCCCIWRTRTGSRSGWQTSGAVVNLNNYQYLMMRMSLRYVMSKSHLSRSLWAQIPCCHPSSSPLSSPPCLPQLLSPPPLCQGQQTPLLLTGKHGELWDVSALALLQWSWQAVISCTTGSGEPSKVFGHLRLTQLVIRRKKVIGKVAT